MVAGVLVAWLACLASPGLPPGDTLRVRVSERPVWGLDPTLVEEIRIGALEGDERYTFGLVAGVAVSPDGTIWVSDRVLGTLRRYSPEGVHLGAVGRKGKGPGEFEYLMDVRMLPDGAVAVWDPLNTRIHIFEQDGRFREDLFVPVRGMYGIHEDFEVDTAGHYYAIAAEVGPGGPASFKAYWLKLSREGVLLDTVRMVPSGRRGREHPVVTQTAVSPMGYLVHGRTDAYAFQYALRTGSWVLLERDVDPEAYARDERAEAQRFEDLFAERNGEEPRRIPERKPAWASLHVDVEGRFWVRRYTDGVRVEERDADRQTREKFGNPPRTWGSLSCTTCSTREGPSSAP
ncbi:MAG: hypothetical protein AMXMBFR53_45390 [Gemmatimonadota bacterium]